MQGKEGHDAYYSHISMENMESDSEGLPLCSVDSKGL